MLLLYYTSVVGCEINYKSVVMWWCDVHKQLSWNLLKTSAIFSTSWGVSATLPLGQLMPNCFNSFCAWYSWMLRFLFCTVVKLDLLHKEVVARRKCWSIIANVKEGEEDWGGDTGLQDESSLSQERRLIVDWWSTRCLQDERRSGQGKRCVRILRAFF